MKILRAIEGCQFLLSLAEICKSFYKMGKIRPVTFEVQKKLTGFYTIGSSVMKDLVKLWNSTYLKHTFDQFYKKNQKAAILPCIITEASNFQVKFHSGVAFNN